MPRRSALVDTNIIYCGDCLDQLRKFPDACVDLVYIDPPFNSNRDYEVFWGETRERRGFEDRHASTQAYIDFMRPRCVEIARVLKPTGSFYFHCDWHANGYVRVMLDQIFGGGRLEAKSFGGVPMRRAWPSRATRTITTQFSTIRGGVTLRLIGRFARMIQIISSDSIGSLNRMVGVIA